ncbi:haloacid dehalogenase type II [Aeromicrobium sp. REDSEA-S32_B7]|jgi:2-haloacid dehalogenase|uniref:haloacid dehalogenase type II n=1 Tax=Aeromicrobium sp. REDSEA-S32_B7 TaxID=1811526 RepID=UPI000A7BB9B2|nr:haloacid dehalogenase type II [Aeromicrobium sp. REDSEA-S32_B7]
MLPVLPRRTLLIGAAASTVAAALPARAAAAAPIRAIGFDGFPIFDPRGVAARVKAIVGDKGEAFSAQWSAKLFGYSWLETAAGRYRDFRTTADAALRHTAAAMQVTLSDAERAALVGAYDALDVWPDVRPALETLRGAGIRLAFLSNLGADSLTANMRRNDIAHYFDAPLSTDRVSAFKPSPKAYAMALDAWDIPREQIGFAAFGGWDAVGATWFGYRTAWVNRFGVPAEPLGVEPAITSRGIEGVLALAGLV